VERKSSTRNHTERQGGRGVCEPNSSQPEEQMKSTDYRWRRIRKQEKRNEKPRTGGNFFTKNKLKKRREAKTAVATGGTPLLFSFSPAEPDQGKEKSERPLENKHETRGRAKRNSSCRSRSRGGRAPEIEDKKRGVLVKNGGNSRE